MGVIAMKTGIVWGAAGWLCRSLVRYAIGRHGELDWLIRMRESLDRDSNRIDLDREDEEAVRLFRDAVAELTDAEALKEFLPAISDEAVLARIRERIADLVELIDRERLDAA